ncbi:uncharacterized protein LOC142893595 isoform X2 [Nelusetta ayraudi]|uniref:uncharacterized protein LOC142893595 isoform X2 n=1 Tax=Nelusetta ayraudi TaxID=303726 RepID=UPI003F709E18
MNKTPCYSEESKDTSSGMANATTVETSYTQENSKDDECRENIPPGITSTSQSLKLEVHIDDTEGCASTQQGAEFESCISSTPAPANNNVKAKSRLSGIQSALTPILKYLNIGNKGSSPETLTEGNNSGRSVSTKTARALSQRSNSELTSSCSRQPPGDTEVCWLADECLPDITLLDVTCDTTMLLAKNDSALPNSLPSTPVRAHPVQTSITPKPSPNIPQICLLKNTQSLLPPTVGCPTKESDAAGNATASKNTYLILKQSSLDAEKGSSCAMQEVTFDKQESSVTGPSTICTLSSNPPKMEVTLTMSNTSSHDSHHSSWEKLSFSEVCSGDGSQVQAVPTEMSKYDGNLPSKHPTTKMADFPESIDAPLCFLDSRFFPEITLLDVTCDTVFSPQSKTPSVKVAPNIPSKETLKKGRLSSEKNVDVTQELSTSNLVQNEDSAGPVDGNADNKPNYCGEQSGKCVGENIPKAPLETTRDISMGSFLENSRPSAESSSQSLEKTQTPVVEAVCGNPANLTHDISSSSIASAPSDTQCNMNTKNATFELHEPSTSMNAVSEDRPQSLDSDLSSKENQLNPNAPESENGTFIIAEQASDLSANGATPMPRSQNQTLELPSDPRAESDTKDEPTPARNDTNRTPPAVSHNCPPVEPSAPCAAQNVTFERHSLQRSTNSIIIGEAAAATSDRQNNTFDIKSSKQNATITICETSSSDSQRRSSLEKPSPPKGCPATGSPKGNNSEVLLATKHNGTKSGAVSEAKKICTPEGKCKSDPSIHGDSDVSVHQSIGVEENRGGTFCLDESLDLREDRLITSTPMVDSKMFNLNAERDQGKIMLAQKKLYRDPPVMSNSQLSSNIVSDRKTFLTQPATKSLQPPLKAASQLLMKKPTSAIPGRPEPLVSGVPVTRLRSQAEALRATTSDAAQVATKGMSCYNLRTTTAGSKHPVSGIQKPRSNFLQSGIQRPPQALRPPAAKYAPAVSASTDNPQVPAASNPVMKISLAKKHHVSKAEVLPIAKKRKMDVPLPSETLTSCASMNGTKNLKRPATSHKPLPLKTPRVDVPANTTEMPTSGNDVSKVRALKQPATKQISQLPKPQGNELLKYTKPAQD